MHWRESMRNIVFIKMSNSKLFQYDADIFKINNNSFGEKQNTISTIVGLLNIKTC